MAPHRSPPSFRWLRIASQNLGLDGGQVRTDLYHKLGLHQTLVVSDSKMAKECFTTNDKVFANRPEFLAAELLGCNYFMLGFSPYGPYWHQLRKIVTLELLSNRQLEMLGHIRVSEMKASIKDIYSLWLKNKDGTSDRVKMKMTEWFGILVLNIVVRIIGVKRYLPDDGEEIRLQKAVMRKFFTLSGKFVVADFVPFLRCLDIGGCEKKMKKTAKELDYIVDRWLQEHKRKRKSTGDSCDEQDFIDVMLSNLETASKDEFSGFDHDSVVKATCMSALLAATDTKAVTLTWALSLQLNNYHVLKKAQREPTFGRFITMPTYGPIPLSFERERDCDKVAHNLARLALDTGVLEN
ncbi:hypothetical protein LguiB_020026 [Lonicera macranthoides]